MRTNSMQFEAFCLSILMPAAEVLIDRFRQLRGYRVFNNLETIFQTICLISLEILLNIFRSTPFK